MRAVAKKFIQYCADRKSLIAMIESVVLFIVSLVINYAASIYATRSASNSVTDLILNNIKARDVDGIYIYGSMVFAALVVGLLILEPKRIAFVMKSLSLFVLVRAVFISLTHVGPFAGQALATTNSFIGLFLFNADLFFSGHTGMPFLLAVLFWPNLKLRWIFLVISVLFAIIVLLGHFHYSIDVFAAYFISFAIAELAKFIFKKDYQVFKTQFLLT